MTLFENFNTSKQKSPSFERHENFVIDLKPLGCALVQSLSFKDRCAFVKSTEECKEGVQLFDYTHLFYCSIDAQTQFEQVCGILALALISLYLFAFVANTTEKFFCPPLKMMTKIFGMSEGLAGITLLAFGNGTPELVTSLFGLGGELGTLYSDLMGSAMFITALISGVIIFIRPLKAEPLVFLRDICFPMLAISFINYSIKGDQSINVSESITIVAIYGCYLLIVVIDQILLIQTIRSLTRAIKQKDVIEIDQVIRLKKLRKEAGIEIQIKKKIPLINIKKKKDFGTGKRNEKLFLQFFTSLIPIELEEWHEGGICGKIIQVLFVPINLILFLLVPTVDFNADLNGWSKLLNCLQIIGLPATISFLFAGSHNLFGFPVPLVTCFFTVPIAILVFIFTRTDTTPSLHVFFAVMSMVGSICLIRVFAKEIISIIDVLGIVTYSSKSFLGCAVLSCGNRVGDLIAGISLAKHGFQRMGFASCYAGPLFCLSLGLGCTYLIRSLESETHIISATQGSMGDNCTIFLLANLVGLVLAASSTNFNIRRSIGAHLIATYLLFFSYALMGESQFIHPFGTDHTEDLGNQLKY